MSAQSPRSESTKEVSQGVTQLVFTPADLTPVSPRAGPEKREVKEREHSSERDKVPMSAGIQSVELVRVESGADFDEDAIRVTASASEARILRAPSEAQNANDDSSSETTNTEPAANDGGFFGFICSPRWLTDGVSGLTSQLQMLDTAIAEEDPNEIEIVEAQQLDTNDEVLEEVQPLQLVESDAPAWPAPDIHSNEPVADIPGLDGRPTMKLLQSMNWVLAGRPGFSNLIRRLELIETEGLKPMKVLSASRLAELGRIPRSDEKEAVSALHEVLRCGRDGLGLPKAILVYFSHKWSRPDWKGFSDAGLDVCTGDPDTATHEKAEALVEWAKWLKWRQQRGAVSGDITTSKDAEVFFWIDWPCVDQENPGPHIASLPAYMSACSLFATYHDSQYVKRAWCQVEVLLAYALMTDGDRIWEIERGFKHSKQASQDKRTVVIPDPITGELSVPRDSTVVAGLRHMALTCSQFSAHRIALRNSGQSRVVSFLCDGLLCCGCFGLFYVMDARKVRPGALQMVMLTPLSV